MSRVLGPDPESVAGGEPVALSAGGAGHGDVDAGVGGMGEAGTVPGVRAGCAEDVGVADVALRPGQDSFDPLVGQGWQVGIAASWAAIGGVAQDSASAVGLGVVEDVVDVPVGVVVG